MPISIYRTDDELIATVEDAETVRDAVISLTKKGANLAGANLVGARLDGANLAGARLDGANLDGANLVGARLYGANLDGARLAGASLYGANLAGASLVGASLAGARLDGANLAGANLDGANLAHAKLPTGETFEEYTSIVLPALLTLGGKSLTDVTASWDCHEWSNCPMHFAFDFDGNFDDASPLVKLMRPRIEQFVQLFDAKLLPREMLGDSTPA